MPTCDWSKIIFTLYQKNALKVYDFVSQDYPHFSFCYRKDLLLFMKLPEMAMLELWKSC